VGTEPAARPRACELFDALRCQLESLGNAVGAVHHEPTLIRVQSDRMSLSEHALHDGAGLFAQMIVDEKERGVYVLAAEDVEQQRRRSWIGAVVVGEIDDWCFRGARQVPRRIFPVECLQEKRERGSVRQREYAQGHRAREEQHQHAYYCTVASRPL
jgi:hypothetical protein